MFSSLLVGELQLHTTHIFHNLTVFRILRAMFEICLKRGWAIPARAALDMCKMAEKRMWSSMTPLRQFKGVPGDILRHAEAKQFVSFLLLLVSMF